MLDGDIIIILAALRVEKKRCLKAVDDEPEYPRTIPYDLWKALRGDHGAIMEALRIIVRLTKKGIRERILSGEEDSE